jgi:hypothetical protein
MPAKDLYHDAVVHALVADGWTITDDPLRIGYGGQNFYVDLGAARDTIAAEKAGQKIAVEIKSFLSPSMMRDLHVALGQYHLYRDILAEKEPERTIYLAVTTEVYDKLFAEKFGRFVVERQQLKLLVFDPRQERVVEWIAEQQTS